MRALSCTATAGVALALVVAGAAPATAASTWLLEPLKQRICVHPDSGDQGVYFIGSISGRWSKTITTGLRNLPPGSYSRGSTILPPGSHKNPPGSMIMNVFSAVSIEPAPAGEYVSELWATDGAQTQSMPVGIGFQERC